MSALQSVCVIYHAVVMENKAGVREGFDNIIVGLISGPRGKIDPPPFLHASLQQTRHPDQSLSSSY